MSAYRLMKAAILIELKDNIEDNLSYYESGDNEEILEKLGVNDVDFDDTLIVSDPSNKSKDDLENAIQLYEKFKDIPLSLASDEHFWAYLTHTNFWQYMCRRWPLEEAKKGNEIEFIKTRYFFNSKNKTFYRNGLSRLWWYVYLTIDETIVKDPYYYTRIMLSDQELASLLIESPTISRNQVALKAILEVIAEINRLVQSEQIEKIKNKRKFLRELIKYINLIGGVTIWDVLSEEEA